MLASRPARRALRRRALAALVAVAAAAWSHTQIDAAQDLRRRWDPTEEVVVVGRDLAAGEPVAADALVTERRPAALVPDGALRAPPGDGRRAAVALVAGEVLVERRLTDAAAASSRVPPGHVAITVQASGADTAAVVGDLVDLFGGATDPAWPAAGPTPDELVGDLRDGGAASGGGATRVASGGIVLDVVRGDGVRGDVAALVVAVSRADAAATSAAVLAGPLAVVVRPATG